MKKNNKILNKIMLEVYIFGASRDIIVLTEHTKQEIEDDWDLREKLVHNYLIEEANVQMGIEEL